MFLLTPGSVVSASIALYMYRIAFEMYQIAFEMKLRMRRRKWIFGGGADPASDQNTSAMHLRITGREAFLLAPGFKTFRQ